MKTKSLISFALIGLIIYTAIPLYSQSTRPTHEQDPRPSYTEENQKEILLRSYTNNGYLVYEYLVQEWLGNSWSDLNKQIYTYNYLGLITERLYKNWQNNQWVNSMKMVFYYDSHNNVTSRISLIWQNNIWQNSSRELWFYEYEPGIPPELWSEHIAQVWDNNSWLNQTRVLRILGPVGIVPFNWWYGQVSNCEEQVRQTWNNNDWENLHKWDLSYADGYVTEEIEYGWLNFAWQEEFKLNGVYDNHNNLVQTIFYISTYGSWSNYKQFSFVFNESDTLVEKLEQFYNFTYWENDYMENYLFDDSTYLLEKLNKDWINNGWQNYWREIYENNIYGKQTDRIKQWWIETQWVNDLHYSSTYDQHGNLTEQIRQNWGNNTWVNMFRYLYNYVYISAESCLPEGITFATQEQINNFQSIYPNCNEIEGDVVIGDDKTKNDDIISLNGLSVLNLIGGHLSIQHNNYLESLSGLENVTSIGGFLNIESNVALTSLSGLDNINSGSISDLTIIGNTALSICEVQSVCEYITAPGGNIDIYDNSTGCNSQDEVEAACDTLSISEIYLFDGLVACPNPFTSSTTLSYTLSEPSSATIVIYNFQGQQVEKIQREKPKGKHKVEWNTTGLPAGMYYYRIHIGTYAGSGKIIKMK